MKRIGILLSVFFLITSCEDKYRNVDPKILGSEGLQHVSDTLMKDTSSNILFSRLQKNGGFGCIYNFYLPDSLKNKNFNIVFYGRTRTNYAHSTSAICVRAIDKEGKLLDWYSGSLRYYYTDINTWCSFKDSMMFKLKGWLEPYHCISIFSYLPGPTNETFDIDSLQVQFKLKD